MRTWIHELLDNHLSLLKRALQVCSVDILLNVANSPTIEISWQNLIHYGYLDRFTAVAILGNNRTLDQSLQHDVCPWLPTAEAMS